MRKDYDLKMAIIKEIEAEKKIREDYERECKLMAAKQRAGEIKL